MNDKVWNPSDIQDRNTRSVVTYLLRKFRCHGLYLYHVSQYDSCYLKFSGTSLYGSIRVGDHEGRRKYRYKWNLRFDKPTQENLDRNVKRRFYNVLDIDLLVRDLNDQIDYYDNLRITIQRWIKNADIN